MRRTALLCKACSGLLLLASFLITSAAAAQVTSLWYKEVVKDGRIYVFNDPATFKAFDPAKPAAKAITKTAYGPSGETVVFENETALDLYNIKHNKDSEVRAVAKPAAPALPTSLKIGDGELKFGALIQGWYVADASPLGTGTSYLGNNTGVNTFRVRRTEIKLSGKVTPSWGFDVMIDPAKTQSFTAGSDDKILQDMGVSFLGLKGHEITLGQRKIAISEEGLRSSSELDFAERSRITRVIGDQRMIGLFYKGDFSPSLAGQVSITNGTIANVLDTSNDTLFWAARFDVKPKAGMVVGLSGGTSGGEGLEHRTADRIGFHFRWDGTETLPLLLRFEYGRAVDGQGVGKDDIKRDGFYGSALYTFAKVYQVGVRYEEYDQNKDVDGDKLEILTAGFHYLIKGKNINLKADWFSIKQEGRKINSVLEESYNQFVLAAQVAF